MPTRRKRKNPNTAAELARQLGVSRQLIAAHQSKPGAPELSDTESWQEFLAAFGREGSTPKELRNQIAAERLRLLKAMGEKAERANAVEAGKMLPADEVADTIRRAVATAFSVIEKSFDGLPCVIAGLPADQIADHLRKSLDGFKNALRDGFLKWNDDSPAAGPSAGSQLPTGQTNTQ